MASDPNSIEARLLGVLDKAAEMTLDKDDPNAIIAKLAVERKLTAPEICRVVEMYNKARSVAFLKTAEDKTAEYPLADANTIMGRVFKTAAVFGAGTQAEIDNMEDDDEDEKRKNPLAGIEAQAIKMARQIDYGASYETTGLAKAAFDLSGPRRGAKLSPASIMREARDYSGLLNKVKDTLRKKAAEADANLERTLREISAIMQERRSRDQAKALQLLANAYGVERAGKIAAEVDRVSVKPVMGKAPESKTAACAVFPNDPLYEKLAKANELIDRAAIAKADMVKLADSGYTTDPLGMLQEITRYEPPESRGGGQAIDIETTMPAAWSNYLKALRSNENFYKLYTYDPVIGAYPIMDSLKLYNDIARTTPSLADNPLWMKAVLRKALAQGGVFDPFELKALLESGKSTTEERVKRSELTATPSMEKPPAGA